MLIKRRKSMATEATSVKKISTSCLATLAICTAAIAPSAYAGDYQLVDKVVTVKFKATELYAESGTEKVYAKLKKRALSFCKADRSTLSYLKMSLDDCTIDLLDQFIQSADIEELAAYHLAQTAKSDPEKFALNTK